MMNALVAWTHGSVVTQPADTGGERMKTPQQYKAERIVKCLEEWFKTHDSISKSEYVMLLTMIYLIRGE